MLGNENLTKVIALIMAVCCAAFVGLTTFGSQIKSLSETGIEMEYEKKLFSTDKVLDINIVMDQSEWEDMLDNAMSETYYQCDIEINGETFYSVGIRPKGNTSLSTIVNDPNTDRYSFKLEFDQFITGQSCYGLDKLVLNNSYADATYMKEALIYDMFAYIGADSSLYNYAKISVNGEYWGLYLALEAVEESFMLRNYGAENGELYKPDSMEMGGMGGNRGGMDFGEINPKNQSASTEENRQTPNKENFNPENFSGEMPDMGNFDFSQFGGGKGGFSMGGSGSNLNYSDDSLDSYSAIWDGEVTNTNSADHTRVVTALKNISEGNGLEKYMDVDNLLRYAAVHIFSENSDSLSGSMSHNYYLYESGGRLNLLPWDYNLALGGMNGGSATSVVNSAIDDAWNGTDFFDTLMENETYHEEYYAYLEQIVEYILGGKFEEFYTETRSKIDSLVKTDPNAFYSYDEYLAVAETFYEVVTLRGESIKGQLDGTIPSNSAEQKNSVALIDASHLDLSVMGSMNMGGGGFGGNFGGRGERAENGTEPQTEADTQSANDEILTVQSLFAGGGFGGQMPGSFNGEIPEDFNPEDFSGQMPDFGGEIPEGFGEQMPNFGGEAPAEDAEPSTEDIQPNGGAQNGAQNNRPSTGSFPTQTGSSALLQNIILYALSSAIFATAFIFALLYKRRKLR